MEDLKRSIALLADKYARELTKRVHEREEEMRSDNVAHYLIYQLLGVQGEEGYLIDLYQNKGRFLYKYAGAFLEEVAFLCFKHQYPDATKIRIPNNQGQRPKTFEIDCLIRNEAYEIKWRDATTDGDHITKEHTRVKAIQSQGYIPVRLMFYYPNREQAVRIQRTLETLYRGVGGQYYFGDSAWTHLQHETGVDLQKMLIDIVDSRKDTQ
jgi:type II restriction enzyme